MLQFLLGLSTANVSWILAGFLGGLRFYNSPPLFFVGVFALLRRRYYSLQPLKIIAVIAVLGTLPGLLHGFDTWHIRQSVALLVAGTLWFYVYQVASERDIFTMHRTRAILLLYLLYLIVMKIENLVGTNPLTYAVSCVFSWGCGSTTTYNTFGRATYFSTEASYGALAIVATIMPYICANVIVSRSYRAYFLFAVACVVLYFAEGYTSRSFIAFSIAFLVFPRLTVLGIPAAIVLILSLSASLSWVLEDKGALIGLIKASLGGYNSRFDAGIESGSYTSRAMTWIIGAQAFLSAPVLGTGIGGTQSFFYQLYDAGYFVAMSEEQDSMIAGEAPAPSSPMAMRIPAEFGLLGAMYLVYYGWRAMRLAFEPHADAMLRYAFLYSLGAMLLSFCFIGEFLNPCIPAFIVLLAQVLRAKKAVTIPERAPTSSSAFAPESATPSPGIG